MNRVKLLSLNVRGLRDTCKRNRIFSYLSKFKSDIILLQESHVLETDYACWKSDWGKGEIYTNCYSSQSAGQIIMLTRNENVVSHHIIIPGRCHILEMSRGDTSLAIVNIYAPNKDLDQINFYREINQYLQNRTKTDFLILEGDFNIVQCQNKDKQFGTNVCKKLSRS